MIGNPPMWHTWILLIAGVLLIVETRSDIDLHLSRILKNHGNQKTAVINWGYDRGKQEIIIEVQVQMARWIGLALSSDRSLNGSDIVIGGWKGENEHFFYDAHVHGEWPPVKDTSQDYELVALRHNGTHSFLRVWRKFFTCDSNDLDIENDTVRVTAVYGEDDHLEYSEEHMFMLSILFLEIIPNVTLGSDVLVYDLKLTDFHIPVDDTTYTCTFLPLPPVTTKHHIIKYEQIVSPSSASVVHHILVYSCSKSANITSEVSDCYGSDSRFSQCFEVMLGWAVGGEEFYFPEFSGLPIGRENDPKYVRIEIHYSNFDNIEGLIDNSGIRIYYTPNLRKYDCGILMLGVLTFPAHFIPPGAQNFKTYGQCDTALFSEVLDQPMEEMVVSAYLLHAHLTTHGIRIMHYRNGTLVGSLGEDKNFDFSLQQIRHLPGNITIKRGDKILVECTGRTQDKEEVTYGGPSTINEMCLGFLFYYPIVPIAACWSIMDIMNIVKVLDVEPSDNVMDAVVSLSSVDWDDDSRAAAQEAVIKAGHLEVVEHRSGIRVNQTSPALPVSPPVPHRCDDDSSP